MPRSGIYLIENIHTRRVYVGSSVDIRRRWAMHRSQLRRNVHHCKWLQRSWNKYGEESFEFTCIISNINQDDLAEVETSVIYLYRLSVGVFNTAPVGGSTFGIKLGPHSNEHRRKIGDAQRGKKLSSAQIRQISERHRGKKLSESHKAALAKSSRERVHSDETRRKLSNAARNISDETRRKRSESLKATITPQRLAAMRAHGTNISDETRRRRSKSVALYHARRRLLYWFVACAA